MKRIRSRGGHVEFAGRLLGEEGSDAWGMEVGPEGIVLRCVVQDRIAWDHGTWISADGTVFDRWFDPYQGTFVWSGPKKIGIDTTDGHFTTMVGWDSDLKRTLRLTRAIAMAWVEAPRTQLKMQASAIGEPVAENLVWVRTGLRAFEFHGVQMEEAVAVPAPGDTWAPLRYAWRNICGEIVQEVGGDTGVEVSMRGWVRYGEASTRGVRTATGRLFASLPGIGVPFWVDEAVLGAFRPTPPDGDLVFPVHLNGDAGDNSLANLEWRTYLIPQPRHEETLEAVRLRNLADLCADFGIRKPTLWQRIAGAAWELPLPRVRQALRRLAPDFLRTFLDRELRAGRLDVGDRISRCVEACDAGLSDTWTRLEVEDRFGVVQLTRCLLLREALAERRAGSKQ